MCSTAASSWFLFIACSTVTYARSTLPERRHLEHTLMWQGEPLTIAFTRCTLGFHVLLVSLWEWETLLPKVTPLPQISHFAIVGYTSLNHVEKHLCYYYSRCSRKKQVFFLFSCQKNVDLIISVEKQTSEHISTEQLMHHVQTIRGGGNCPCSNISVKTS